MSRYERVYLYLCALFLASLLVCNMFVFKLFDIPLPFVGLTPLIAGIIPYPITFLCTDLISELYGKKRADHVVYAGFMVSVFMLIMIQVAKALPVSHVQADPELVQAHLLAVFGQSARAILASMVAYLVAQLCDVRLFHFWKDLTKGKHLWLRNNASTLVSQIVDTVLVVAILFGGTLPFNNLVKLMVSSYVFKMIIALVDTPFFYLGAHLFKDISAETERRIEAGEAGP
ncbi:MAG: queuosine precursor transporter [Acidobacteria bacterium]|nr:queuosine precursor transporter [Acidobacteriota bacterium]MCB9397306.1 queuosine precursor transporter [Acidobacteriota bacterium]